MCVRGTSSGGNVDAWGTVLDRAPRITMHATPTRTSARCRLRVGERGVDWLGHRLRVPHLRPAPLEGAEETEARHDEAERAMHREAGADQASSVRSAAEEDARIAQHGSKLWVIESRRQRGA